MASGDFPIGAAIRELWPQKDIARAYLEDKPLLGILPKDTAFHEKKRHIVAAISGNQGWGSSYESAKKNRTANGKIEFEIEPKVNYGSVAVDGRIFRRVKAGADKAIIVDELKEATKGLKQTGEDEFARHIHGDGSGRLATVKAGFVAASRNLPVTNPLDMRTMDEGFPVDFVDPATRLARARISDGKVDSVDGENGILVLDKNINAICPTAQAGDWIVREGTANNAPLGFGAWLPLWNTAADLVTPFCSVDRSKNPLKLAGAVFRPAVVGVVDPEEIILQAVAKVHLNKGNPKHVILGTEKWNNLRKKMGDRVRFVKEPAAKIGKISTGIEYTGIELIGGRGPLTVLMDPDAPPDLGRIINKDRWTFASMGEMFGWDIPSTETWRIEDSSDKREVRMFVDGEMYTDAPWEHGTIDYEAGL